MPLLTSLACMILVSVQALGPTAGEPSAAVIRTLAPGGRLRVAINLGNPVLAQQPPGSAEPRGVAAELARELGRRLHLPIDFLTYDGAGKVITSLPADAWDLAFLAIDPVRAGTVTFTHPYVVIEGTYLVPAGSKLRSIDEVDQAGVRVAVGLGSAYDLFLARELKQAKRVAAPSSAEALELFLRDQLEAAAGVRQPLALFADSHPGVRILPGRFMSIRQAIAFPKGRETAAPYLDAFIEELKASGFIARALAASGQADAVVAPPGPGETDSQGPCR
jgi:polar amino acid transport system substrate-binding protein